jgi:hypothetical protein
MPEVFPSVPAALSSFLQATGISSSRPNTGFDYIEFQAPFDFVTTMDHDPLGKNWYIKGTDDGTGKPKLWVQS